MRKVFLILAIFVCFNTVGVAQVLRFVAPSGVGKADGRTAADAVDFLDDAFWVDVQRLLQKEPVTVKFADGDYQRAYTVKTFTLEDIGHVKHRLTLEGTPQTIFSVPAGHEYKPLIVSIKDAINVTIRNFHFRGEGAVRYVLRVSSTKKKGTKDILIENCSWIDMPGVVAGAAGTLHATTSHITFKNCTFKRVGSKSGLMIYNAHHSNHLSIIDSHFEDCPGDFVRFRDNVDYVLVSGSTFVRTELPRSRLRAFISMPTFTRDKGRVETIGTNYAFVNNTFVDHNTIRNIIAFHHYGHDRQPGLNYLLTAEEGSILETGTIAEKKQLLLKNFGVNMDSIRIRGNNFPPNFDNKVVLGSFARLGAESKGWEGFADIQGIAKDSEEPFDWEIQTTDSN